MKLIKNFLSFITAAACCAAISGIMPFSSSAEASATYGDLSYTTVDSDGDGTDDYVEITDCYESVTEIEIPAEIEGLPVTTIGRLAFYNCDLIKEFNIPNNITTIKDSAIACCDKLKRVSIPESVIYIGDEAFAGNFFKEISVSENNNYYCSCNGALFNKDMTFLIEYAVQNGVIDYVVPESVTSIGSCAFMGCNTLKSIKLPENLKLIEDSTFYYCSKLESINIPNGVTSIGSQAFKDCHNLKSVSISDTVTKIGRSAFSNCSSLTMIKLPESVSLIVVSAFENCSTLSAIIIENPACSFMGDSTIYNFKDQNENYVFNGTIYGYENSTAQTYAEKYNRNFVSLGEYTETLIGDISGNGEIDLYDAIEIAKAIMGMRTFTEEEKLIADFNKDGTVDLYDAIEIARTLLPK